uniref:CBS domain-containing protein n=1 Tax=Physcomitrium patens TaxID=3218 RepID=A0A7I4D6C3_PHYPA
MAALLVASSTGVGLAATVGRKDAGSCTSSTARPQLVLVSNRKSASNVAGTSVVPVPVHVWSRGSSFPLPRSTMTENPTPQKQETYTVGDYMTPVSELYCATVNTTIDEALEVLVEKRITGMPVIDDFGALVGVVSDYDLLALDSISGQRQPETSLFPEAGRTWKAFKEIQKLLIKTNGKTVGDVMTPSPLVVSEQTNLEDAARVLLDTKFRRLPVVGDDGKLESW